MDRVPETVSQINFHISHKNKYSNKKFPLRKSFNKQIKLNRSRITTTSKSYLSGKKSSEHTHKSQIK